MKVYWNGNKAPFYVGLIVIIADVGIFFKGSANGIFFNFIGKEAYLHSILGISLGIIMMSRIFYVKKDRDFNLSEWVIFAIILLGIEIVPHFLLR